MKPVSLDVCMYVYVHMCISIHHIVAVMGGGSYSGARASPGAAAI